MKKPRLSLGRHIVILDPMRSLAGSPKLLLTLECAGFQETYRCAVTPPHGHLLLEGSSVVVDVFSKEAVMRWVEVFRFAGYATALDIGAAQAKLDVHSHPLERCITGADISVWRDHRLTQQMPSDRSPKEIASDTDDVRRTRNKEHLRAVFGIEIA